MLSFGARRGGKLPGLAGVSDLCIVSPPLVDNAGSVNALAILPTTLLSVAVGTTSRLMDYDNSR